MSPTERQQAILELIAAQLEDARAALGLKRYAMAYGRMSRNTLHTLMAGKGDPHLSKLIEAADGVNCDVVIEIRRRA